MRWCPDAQSLHFMYVFSEQFKQSDNRLPFIIVLLTIHYTSIIIFTEKSKTSE